MWTTLLVTLIWLSLTYRYGVESLYILIFIDAFVLFLLRRFPNGKKLTLKPVYLAGFAVSFFQSFYQSIRILYFLLRRKLFRGLYEVKVGEISRLDLFFLSMGITIVPNTIYIDRFGDILLVHKLDCTEKAAHEAEPVLFADKKKK
jgi:multisubunit Na+/H+ antiporter MnhE subunit